MLNKEFQAETEADSEQIPIYIPSAQMPQNPMLYAGAVEIEAPYFDKNGTEIKEFAVLKVYHFKGVNEQGRGRKNYYMYKWVRLKMDSKGKMWWVAMHLTNGNENSYYNLRAVGDKQTRFIYDSEIVQQF